MNIQHQAQWEQDVEGARKLHHEVERLETENRRLWEVKERAERIYQGRHRVHDVDKRNDIYHDIIMLGYALKVVDGQMPEKSND